MLIFDSACLPSAALFCLSLLQFIIFLIILFDISSPECTSDQFQCQNDGRCIDKRARCDGRSDCTDSSDEYNCPPQPQPETTIIPETTQKPCYGRCNINNQCYTQEQFCDGHQDCPDGTDENRCRKFDLYSLTFLSLI